MELNQQSSGNRWRIRPDGPAKVSGKLQYLTDLAYPNMLYGKVLRSSHPHAKIKSINTEKASNLNGVVSVITYEDVPALNGFGLIIQDQPVLCKEYVRYVGDAVAAVAAESPEIAEEALRLIDVDYEPLPIVTDPEAACLEDSIKLHPNGNILHQAVYKSSAGLEGVFSTCTHIVEETYYTPRQMHAYMETEGGVVVPEQDGSITVYAPTQHGFKDRLQLSRILGLSEEKIRVISSPIGGSFGGKDELNVQPQAAILAMKTGRPVQIHNSRRESVRAGLKRHPMKLTMKTGTNEHGKILAHQVRIVADTGAYASLGPAVLDFAVEHAVGPYVIEHVDVEGISVFTNNGLAGEFRGFGGNQVTFALESQLDRLAGKIGLSQIEIRERNIRKEDDLGPLGQRVVPNNGAIEVLEEITKSPILRKSSGILEENKWKVKGKGMALTMHGGGLGYGRPDPSGGRLSLNKAGKVEIAFGFEEVGQGLISSIEIILTEQLGIGTDDVSIVIGDTALVPPSGSSTASRATNMIWQGIKRLKGPWCNDIIESASTLTGIKNEKLKIGPSGVWMKDAPNTKAPVITFTKMAEILKVLPSVSTQYHFPTTPDPVVGGHYLYSFAAVAVEVEVDILTGYVRVSRMDHAVSAGPVVNPMGYLGQIEGGGVMALGFTLMEDAVMENGQYMTENFDHYLIPTVADIPITRVSAIETLTKGDEFGPRGVGEIGTVAVAPAITAAIHDAVGYWVTKLPVSKEEILNALTKNKQVPLLPLN